MSNATDVTLRPYREAEADELIELWLASTIPGQAFLPEEHWRAMEPDIRGLMPQARTWVLADEQGLVAFMSVLDNMIGGLFTHPDHQGKGYGARLVDRACEQFDPLCVEVFEANVDALRFYRRCGFVDHETRVDQDSGLTQLILRMQR